MIHTLYEHLRNCGALPAPGDKSFVLRFPELPRVDQSGNWSFLVDFEVPEKAGNITFLVTQFGGGIDVRNVNIPIPPQDFEIPDKEKTTAHHEAFNDLIDRLSEILESKGFRRDKHFSFEYDYLGSEIIELSIDDPRIFRRSIAAAFQKALLKTKFRFVISMKAWFGGKRITDGQNMLIIRRDRVAPDWNAKLLKTVSRGKFSWR